jgi:hypothetical protein
VNKGLRCLENGRFPRLSHVRNFYFKFLRFLMMHFLWLLKPTRFVPHKHFTMFHNTAMRTKIPSTLHPYLSSITPIIKAPFKPLAGISANGRL